MDLAQRELAVGLIAAAVRLWLDDWVFRCEDADVREWSETVEELCKGD